MSLTKTQTNALRWLRARNGDGLFDRHGVVMAAGETANFMRSTWNALRDLGAVEFYGGRHGRGRIRIKEGFQE